MSIIKRITVQTYSYQLNDLGLSTNSARHSRFIVSIETDDGLTGAYAPHFGATGHALAQVKDMAPGLIGQNAEHREQIFERLKNRFRHFDKVGIASLDCALWDLAGKKYGASVTQLLGGYRQRLPVYASTAPGQKSPGGLDSIGETRAQHLRKLAAGDGRCHPMPPPGCG